MFFDDLEFTVVLEQSALSCPRGAVRTLPNTRTRPFRMTGVNNSLKLKWMLRSLGAAPRLLKFGSTSTHAICMNPQKGGGGFAAAHP